MVGGQTPPVHAKRRALVQQEPDAHRPDAPAPADGYVEANGYRLPEQRAGNQGPRWLYDGKSMRQRLAQYQARGAPGQEAAADPLNQRQHLDVDMQEVEAQLGGRQANAHLDADLAVFDALLFPKNREVMFYEGQLLYGPERNYSNSDVSQPQVSFLRERGVYPKVNAPIDFIKYSVEYNVDFLMHSDLLVNRYATMDPFHEHNRELMELNTENPSSARHMQEQAKLLGEAGRDKGLTNTEIVNRIADMIQDYFAEGQGEEFVKKGQRQPLTDFVENGGCCRHRSAQLQLALQKAGYSSRLIQGDFLGQGGTPHAWLEVDVAENGTYSYVIDLNTGLRGKIEHSTEIPGGTEYKVNDITYFRPTQFNMVWRLRPEFRAESAHQSAALPNTVEVLSIDKIREQIDADPNMYGQLMKNSLRGLPEEARRALRDGVLEAESIVDDFAEAETLRMNRERDRDGVSSPREAMERMKAEARDKSGRKK